MNGPKPPPPPPPKPYPAMSFQKVSGDPNNTSAFGEKAAIQHQCETRADDIDLFPLSERKRMLICHDMPSNGLNARQVIPDFGKGFLHTANLKVTNLPITHRHLCDPLCGTEKCQEWPGLPKGVKFDPSDEELLWHLLAEIGKGVPKRHPFIKEFIVFLDEDDGLGNVHPQFLPGVKQDGSMSYFFHRKVQMYSRKNFKRLKQHDGGVEFCWHSNGKFNLVSVDGIHQGSKEVLTLYMNPANDGNPLRTPWLMHQYHIGMDGAEEDLVVSKIFYEMKKDSMDGFKTEVVAVATPLQVAPEFHEKLHVESVSVDESILAFATGTPAELTTEELSQKVMNHGIGGETNAEHVGYLKSPSSQNYGTKYLEKSSVKHYKRSEGTFATDELPLLESSCETATFNDQKECVVGKRPDGFLAYSGDLGISVNNSIYDKVIGDDTCDSNDTHISMEKSCPERAPEHVLQKNDFDRMFKTQGKFIGASRSVEINTTGICSFTGHLSREKHETNSNCLDEAHVSPSRVSSAKHSIARVNAINELFILGLPAFRFKAKPSEETESKFAFEKNSNTWANISVQSDLPIKIEPTSFKDAEIGIASENFSINRSNASELSGLLDKVKAEPFEGADASIILEKCDEELPSFSQSSLPDNSSNCVNFCYSKDNIQEKNNPHFYISKEGTTPCCNLFHQDCIPDDLHIPIDEILSTKIFGMDELLSETNCFINEHPEKDDNVQDGLLMNNDNSQVMGDSDYYPQINVKSEPVENIDLTYSQIPPSNTREDAFLMFENKIELNSDSPLDTLDHAPLKCRLGISVSEGGDIVKSGNISEDVASVAPGCRSFGSVNTKKCQSASRRKRKKTATNSVEKAMEEDSPGLLKALLERGIQVEEIKLYGDLEDNDPLETSFSEGSFEELETVVTKLFSERSSLLRFTSGRSMKGSRGVYYLAGLISLIEQTRYLRFRHTPVDWGWCRDLQSFIFVFHTHNRIVLERPEYGYATYFFELVDSLPIDWQIKRLVKAMKLTNCSRTVLLENKTLIVGEDLSEGEAHVLEGYGWARNTGFGTLLNYVDRVVHDKRSVMYSSEWRAKIRKMLMSGYDGGRMVLANIPVKVVQYLGTRSSEIKMEL